MRWWESPGRSIEAEAAWFEEAGLEFALDEAALADHEIVVFRGVLRLGERTSPATVVFPPAYGAGAQPVVMAPELRLGRHQAPSGALCLDHPVLGHSAPMYGAEAAARAQRLWDLHENDPVQLAREEADAPDPRTNYYAYEEGSAVILADADVTGYERGYISLAATQARPLRAGVTSIRATRPAAAAFAPGDLIAPFAGATEIHGPWIRLPAPPPVRPEELVEWLKAEHRALVDKQLVMARNAARTTPGAAALIAFVFPDEGPNRGETHDAWLFVVLDPPQGALRIPFAFHLRAGERWLRQPQLEALGRKRIAIVGVGALGSPVADHLAKAGLGDAVFVDHDLVTPGNRVRHLLDISDAGRRKVAGVAARARRVNPWGTLRTHPVRLGEAGQSSEAMTQRIDDTIIADLETCDVIVNTSANSVTGMYLSQIAHGIGVPVVHAYVSAGGWGGRVLVQRPGASGCWECLGRAQVDPGAYEAEVAVPNVPTDPAPQEVLELGCGDPTFTGAGFDLAAAAAATARVVVGVALEDEAGYPALGYDLLTLGFRGRETAVPTSESGVVPVHPACEICSVVAAAA